MKSIASVVLAAAVSVTAATTHAAAHRTGIARLTPAQRHAVRAAGEWHHGCPVWMSELRVALDQELTPELRPPSLGRLQLLRRGKL